MTTFLPVRWHLSIFLHRPQHFSHCEMKHRRVNLVISDLCRREVYRHPVQISQFNQANKLQKVWESHRSHTVIYWMDQRPIDGSSTHHCQRSETHCHRWDDSHCCCLHTCEVVNHTSVCMCVCGTMADARELHGLCFRKSVPRHQRQSLMTDVICRAVKCLHIPIAVKTGGPWNTYAVELIKDLGKRVSEVANESLQTQYLFQRLSMTVQRGNAIAFKCR